MSFFILLTHVPLINVYTLYKYSISLIVFIKLCSYFFPAFIWFALNYRNKLQAFFIVGCIPCFLFGIYVFKKFSFKLFNDILARISFFKFLHSSVFCCASYSHHEKGEGKHHGYTCAYSRHHRRAELGYGRPVPVRSHRQHFRRHEHRRIAHHLYDRGLGRNLGHLHPVPPRWHPSFRRERITAETKTGFRAG